MNCRRFEDLREEFLDGTLPPRERVAAEEHLAGCVACTERLRQRGQAGERVANVLQQATQSLRLRPEVEQRILREWARDSAKVPAPRAADWFAKGLLWRWAAAAVFVVAVVWGVGRLAAPRHLGARDGDVIIEVSYSAPVYAFQQDGDFVRDTLNYETVTVNTRFAAENHPAVSSKR
jgi:anti-sigma factor RsiW